MRRSSLFHSRRPSGVVTSSGTAGRYALTASSKAVNSSRDQWPEAAVTSRSVVCVWPEFLPSVNLLVSSRRKAKAWEEKRSGEVNGRVRRDTGPVLR